MIRGIHPLTAAPCWVKFAISRGLLVINRSHSVIINYSTRTLDLRAKIDPTDNLREGAAYNSAGTPMSAR